MRRRIFGLLLSVATVVACLLPVVAATAAPGESAVVLAAETGGEEGEAPGLDPAGPNETDNPAAPEDYEANFLWGAAVGLLALTILGAVALGGLYYVQVVRPRKTDAASH